MNEALTAKKVFDIINAFAPFNSQCSWDNSGIIAGDPDKPVHRIAVVLDITSGAVEYAAGAGVDLIVSHHPVIFRPARSVLAGDPVFALVSHGISAVCAHTNLDKAKGGVNDALAEKLGFGNAEPLCEETDAAMVRVADIPQTTAEALAGYVSEKLGGAVRFGDAGKLINKVALCGGSGSDFAADAAKAGCDALITGDASHHDFLDAAELGITLLAAGHFETENPVVDVLAEKLRAETDAEIIIIPQNSPIKNKF